VRSAIAAGLAVFLSVTICQGQRPPRQQGGQGASSTPSSASSTSAHKNKKGPRALAVLEFLPNGAMRLVPVALLMDGHYYDASLYGANPAPMAVEPQTVYEAQSFGEPTGTFTITVPKQVNGNWVADGTWSPHLAMDEDVAAKSAKDAANKAKNPPSRAVTTEGMDVDDSRPVLKRAPGSAGDSPGSSSGQSSPSTTASDSDRPVMKRPDADSSSKPTMGPSDDPQTTASNSKPAPATVDDHDADRPVMKRPSSSSPSSSPASGSGGSTAVTQQAAASNDSDPNRPMLSRGKPIAKPATTPDDLTAPANNQASVVTAKGSHAYPAISDAGDYRGRPMLYSMSPGERKTQEDQVLKLAMDEIRAFAAKHNGPAIPKTASITDYDVRAFDLDYSSSPTIVLSAKLPVSDPKAKTPANFSYFATIVARVDINDQPQKIFSSVTDSRHLDAYPRYELIDAVDADANGRGDLLFRQYSDTGISYSLYRVSAYQLDKIFEGGSAL
jgi:hypothetical protein